MATVFPSGVIISSPSRLISNVINTRFLSRKALENSVVGIQIGYETIFTWNLLEQALHFSIILCQNSREQNPAYLKDELRVPLEP
ncbi:hypothetical protein F511_15083 [Dorcoceras hygrometricum]|uniref:Uncharacterized protein n=1 Tax=Dorcoceras hygrometricum TaxID=472368 RepID=A0A2Z7BRD7_9LAMI|nr:hypothetical protein F511_15083 [Dorcoceras hygrometricum]